MSRHAAAVFASSLLAITHTTVLAQDEDTEVERGAPPERIDILVEPVTNEPEYNAECVDEQEAAAMFGEIVVCRRRSGDENRLYDRETAARRHAERTQGEAPVDVAGPGIFRGPPTVSGLCFIPPCPKDPVYMIDFAELPDAPPGSDADRVARGLAPRGRAEVSTPAPSEASQPDAAELGLPPAPGARQEGLSPSGSASREGER